MAPVYHKPSLVHSIHFVFVGSTNGSRGSENILALTELKNAEIMDDSDPDINFICE
jgi:hypothetical protein